MAYTARTLITRSWYLSGIVARNLQDVTGDQATDGLMLLNALLDYKQVQTDLIPYYSYNTTYYTVAGQEKLIIPNCAAIQSLTFNIGTVRFPIQYVSPKRYFGSARVDGINSLPMSFTMQRELGGSSIYLYFNASTAYQLKIYGKFFLTDVTLDTDLLTVFDTSYIEYLRYALAEYMCSEYGVELNPQSQKKLLQMQSTLRYLSPPDLTNTKVSMLKKDFSVGWGFVNMFDGFFPGSF